MIGDFPHSLRFHDYTVTKSGDKELTHQATVPADVELFLGLSQTNYSDETIGSLNAAIPADNPYYLSHKEKLQGKLVEFGENWYRVTEVRPAQSAYTNEEEFVDLVAEKAEI